MAEFEEMVEWLQAKGLRGGAAGRGAGMFVEFAKLNL
jgi:hypothetical protein